MAFHYFSYRPPHWIQATAELNGQHFLVSAVRGDGRMDMMIRCSSTLMAPIKLPLPLDVDKDELEAIVEMLVDSMFMTMEQAA